MSIEKQLDANVKAHKDLVEHYYQNPDLAREGDILEFSRAVGNKHVSFWAQKEYMTNSYDVAKKIIESIN